MKYTYTGEVDQLGAVCGEGIAKFTVMDKFTFVMTCLNGENHGICKSLSASYIALLLDDFIDSKKNSDSRGYSDV